MEVGWWKLGNGNGSGREIKSGWLLCVQEAIKDGQKGSNSAKGRFFLLDR